MIKKTLYFGNPCYLSLQKGQIVIKLPAIEKSILSESFKKESIITRPIEDIGFVVLDNPQITITSGLISALLENNCAVISCDKSSMPTGMTLVLAGNTLQNERFRNQLDASIPLKKQLWQQTIQAKIWNQSVVLNKQHQEEHGCMKIWSTEVKSGDTDNLEARAAAYYWRNLFPSTLHFIRDRMGDYPNNILNFGYAILRGVIARALVGSGLLPTLGIHHSNKYNAYCLADDIMEPYRPYVDEIVVDMFKKGIGVELDKEAKQQLLTIPNIDVVINDVRRPLMVAASMTTASLSKCFNGEIRKIIYPIMK